MTTYNDDQLEDEIESQEEQVEEEAAGGNNRNFFLALGILGGLFLVVTIVLVLLWLNNRQPDGAEVASISATNVAIQTANAQTAVAATLAGALRLTELVPPPATVTPIPPTVTATPLLAQAGTKTGTPEESGAISLTVTATEQAGSGTQSVSSVLTQSSQQTATRQSAINLTGTATTLPQSGFADEVGLPGLFGMALGLVLVIILVRRLRFSTSH